ncbi:MAG: hypothetical protein DYH15_07920 [Nitrosomonas sp. PRO4]|nr:hypothetical protein [Nitrosomonas sp. PRO4]
MNSNPDSLFLLAILLLVAAYGSIKLSGIVKAARFPVHDLIGFYGNGSCIHLSSLLGEKMQESTQTI